MQNIFRIKVYAFIYLVILIRAFADTNFITSGYYNFVIIIFLTLTYKDYFIYIELFIKNYIFKMQISFKEIIKNHILLIPGLKKFSLVFIKQAFLMTIKIF